MKRSNERPPTAIRLHAEIQPIPKVAMTQRSKWKEKARSLLDYQEALAWLIKLQNRDIKQITGPVSLSATFTRTGRKIADLKNLIWALEDALQYSGLIKNDRQIVRYEDCRVTHGARTPFITIEVTEIR